MIPHPQQYWFIDKAGIEWLEQLAAQSNFANGMTLSKIIDDIHSRPYISQQSFTCPQNKIWQYCPVAEQIRQAERDKMLDIVDKLIDKSTIFMPKGNDGMIFVPYDLIKGEIKELRSKEEQEGEQDG